MTYRCALVVTNDPYSYRQKGDGFEVGQTVYLSNRDNLVCTIGKVKTYDDGIASIDDIETLDPADCFVATDTSAIQAVSSE